MVNNKKHDLLMPPIATVYSDYELAALVTYIQHFNGINKDKIVSIEQVKEARKMLEDRNLTSTLTAKQVHALPSLTKPFLSPDTLVDPKTGQPIE